MIDILEYILTYISGFYTLPWILVGFFVTILLGKVGSIDKIDRIMKKIGLVLLYFFIPLLLFRIFLNIDFGKNQIEFSIVVSTIIFFMYLLAYYYAKHKAQKWNLTEEKKQHFIKTTLTNQGRSSAFIGGALLAFTWRVEAAIYIAIVGIALFAIIPAILSYMNKKETKKREKNEQLHALPWFLKLYPWYLITFVIVAVTLHATTGFTTKDFGNANETILIFYTAITIPAALYYVGASIHLGDLKKSELKKLLGLDKKEKDGEHWSWVRSIFTLTVIITPVLTLAFFGPLFATGFISNSWLAVIVINSILPITSTNMFLVPYGIDKKSTAHAVTWTTIICVPIIVFLIFIFNIYIP